MKAEELFVGAIVANTNGNVGKVIGIRPYMGTAPSMKTDYEIVVQYHQCGTAFSDPKLLVPIPLTPEILKKNGFVESGCPFTFDTGDDDVIIELYDPDPRARLSDKNRYDKEVGVRLFRRPPYSWGMDECMIIRANYVHELQVALRVVGIEKEIVV